MLLIDIDILFEDIVKIDMKYQLKNFFSKYCFINATYFEDISIKKYLFQPNNFIN